MGILGNVRVVLAQDVVRLAVLDQRGNRSDGDARAADDGLAALAGCTGRAGARTPRRGSSFERCAEPVELMKTLSSLDRGEHLDLPLFGSSAVYAIERSKARSAHDVGIWWLRTRIGQTLAITKVTRASAQTSLRDGPSESEGKQAATEAERARPGTTVSGGAGSPRP
jgi:hypothetical protein